MRRTEFRVALVGYDFQTARLRQVLTPSLDGARLLEFDLRVDGYEDSLRAFAPDLVIQYGTETTDEPKAMLNGRYQLAARLAPTVFAENAWFPQKDYLYLDEEGLADQSTVARLQAGQLPPVDRQRLDETLAAYRHTVLPLAPLPQSEGFLLLCLQMPQDTVIVRASPFQDMQVLIDRVEAALPDIPIIVRPHPDDEREYHTTRAELRRDGVVAEWIVQARLVLACNSTTLLEAMALGVPAAAMGRGLFTGKGVCWEWNGAPSHLPSCLDFRPERDRVDAFLWELVRRQLPLRLGLPDHREHNPVLRNLRRHYA